MTTPLPAINTPSWRLWLIWGVGVAAYIVSITNRTSLSAVGVDAAVRFDADASVLSLFAVVQLAVYATMQVPVGLLLDRFGARPIITMGMATMAVGQLVMAFAPDVGTALVARVLLGAGDAAIFPSVLRVVAVWFPPRQAPFLVQMTGLLGQAGQLISIVPLAALLHATSWSIAFGSLAGLGVLFTVLTFAVIRNRPPDRSEDVSVDTETGAIQIVRSSVDLRQGFKESWAHPATRLAFWSHFTTPFSGTAFMLLWGFPFLTVGQGLTPPMASLVFSVYVVFGMASGPVIGALSSRHPQRRSRMLVLPIIGLQAFVWLVVIFWPGQAPLWLLFVLAFAMSTGGPASMIGFDHARTFNPAHRLSTATGIVNVGGFLAALLAIFFIGLAMDLQGAGSPSTYSLDAFRVAFLTQVPLWVLGSAFIVIERRRTRVHIGLDEPRPKRSRRTRKGIAAAGDSPGDDLPLD
ncbi:Predicted arabinose efflux permease, MFS family [Agromyces sp. CF514]|uniref:MFS transporter n=1 Tax=Agromyces sp. CF514 TaxID=1881031 RepID=UPI0008E26FD9|nr:MFS transporter [Agromyces sp. CF514]SFR83831.1 Predicted arabinose efflux permease, MFS family [Agromyces sp. CF514]